jgi:hypothetical protein
MKKILVIILSTVMTFSLVAEKVNSVNAPKGKMHIYKQKGDTAREMEIFFPI